MKVLNFFPFFTHGIVLYRVTGGGKFLLFSLQGSLGSLAKLHPLAFIPQAENNDALIPIVLEVWKLLETCVVIDVNRALLH